MATQSTNRKFLKPDRTDILSVGNHINGNMDVLDRSPGTFTCTAATRPSTPYLGQQIFETDTKRIYRWNGVEWYPVQPVPTAMIYRTTNENFGASSQWNKCILDTVQYDPWSMYVPASYWLKIPYDGRYACSGSIHINLNHPNAMVGLGIFKNADVSLSQINQYIPTYPSTGFDVEIGIDIILKKDDTVYLVCWNHTPGGGSMYNDGTPRTSQLSVAMIGPVAS